MYLVIKHDGKREVGVNSDGSTSYPLEDAQVYATSEEADKVAAAHGGDAFTEERIFGYEDDQRYFTE